MAKTCEKCNGMGLISTGADPLALHQGIQVTCAACAGRGKFAETVEEIAEGFVPAVPEEVKAEEIPVPQPPKVEDSNQSAPSGSESSDGSDVGANETAN